MIAFEVHLNGKKLCTAGLGELGVLTSIVSWRGPQPLKDGTVPPGAELRLEVGGLSAPAEEHVRWAQRDLRIGDEVRISVIEAGVADPPLKPGKVPES